MNSVHRSCSPSLSLVMHLRWMGGLNCHRLLSCVSPCLAVLTLSLKLKPNDAVSHTKRCTWGFFDTHHKISGTPTSDQLSNLGLSDESYPQRTWLGQTPQQHSNIEKENNATSYLLSVTPSDIVVLSKFALSCSFTEQINCDGLIPIYFPL